VMSLMDWTTPSTNCEVSDELEIWREAADLVLDTRVLSLGVFTDKNSVDIVVGGLVSLDGDTGSDIGKEGECSSESQVE
jgi:hypothetical protein